MAQDVDSPRTSQDIQAELAAKTEYLKQRNIASELANVDRLLKRDEAQRAFEGYDRLQESYAINGQTFMNPTDFMPIGWGLDAAVGTPYLAPREANVSELEEGSFPPCYTSERDLSQYRALARFVANVDCPGAGIVENLKNYIVGKGFTHKISSRKGVDARQELLDIAQEVLDKAIDDNSFTGRLDREILGRSSTDGEVAIQLNPNMRDGSVDLQILEMESLSDCGSWPEVEAKYDFPTWFTYGIHTPKRCPSKRLGYTLMNGDGQWTYMPESRIVHLTRNSSVNAKRGVSDFFPAYRWLQSQQKLLSNTAAGASELSAIAYIVQYESASKTAAAAMRSANADVTYTLPGGRTENVQYKRPGSIMNVPKGQQYISGPSGDGTPLFLDIMAGILRLVGSRFCMSEGMISGDDSNNNLASSITAGSRFHTYAICRQQEMVSLFQDVWWRVLKITYNAGRFSRYGFAPGTEGTWARLERILELKIEPPEVDVLSKKDQNEINIAQVAAGLMSKTTARQKASLDDDVELKNIEKEAASVQQATPMPGGFPGAPAAPGQPAPAQPGVQASKPQSPQAAPPQDGKTVPEATESKPQEVAAKPDEATFSGQIAKLSQSEDKEDPSESFAKHLKRIVTEQLDPVLALIQGSVLAPKQPEPDQKQNKKYSCIMAVLEPADASEVLAVGAGIADRDLAEDGRELECHVTLKYGLLSNDARDVLPLFRDVAPIELTLGDVSLFPASDNALYDVVKLDVNSADLMVLNSRVCANLPYADSHPIYTAHLTLAYCKPGTGQKYVGPCAATGKTVVIDRLVFSPADGSTKVTIPLTGKRDSFDLAVEAESCKWVTTDNDARIGIGDGEVKKGPAPLAESALITPGNFPNAAPKFKEVEKCSECTDDEKCEKCKAAAIEEFRSEAQRRWMRANDPKMADRWEKETPDKDLPEYVEEAFCPTGDGGGVDNSCSASGGSVFDKDPDLRASVDKVHERIKLAQKDLSEAISKGSKKLISRGKKELDWLYGELETLARKFDDGDPDPNGFVSTVGIPHGGYLGKYMAGEAFCPTGDGGGIDNSCSSREGGSQDSARIGEYKPRGQVDRRDSSELLARIKAAGGFTYQPVDDTTPTKGYALSVFRGAEKVFDVESVTEDDIYNYLIEHKDKFEDPGVHVGGWVDDGKVYLDLSIVVEDREKAEKLGIEHDQLAMFDLANFNTIHLESDRTKREKGTVDGERKGKAGETEVALGASKRQKRGGTARSREEVVREDQGQVAKKKAGEAFCPTGDGGGIDNSCSSRDGGGVGSEHDGPDKSGQVSVVRKTERHGVGDLFKDSPRFSREEIEKAEAAISEPKNKEQWEEFNDKVRSHPLYVQASEQLASLASEVKGREGSHKALDVRSWSKERHTDNDGNYTPERAKLHEEIIGKMLNEKAVAPAGTRPKAVLLTGAPGSGKTSAGQPLTSKIAAEFTVINADDVKAAMPEYRGWNAGALHEESTAIAEGTLRDRAMDARHNILFDITGNNGDKMEKIANELVVAGYDVHVVSVTVPSHKSSYRAWKRFSSNAFHWHDEKSEPGRFVPIDYVHKSVDGNPDRTYERLKKTGKLSSWSKVDNDVPRGTQPKIVDQGSRENKAVEAMSAPTVREAIRRFRIEYP